MVSHDGLVHVFDFSNHSGDKNKIQWAAFYSDCIHKVKPVLEGHRVTITYNITLPSSVYHKKRYFHHLRSNNDPDSLDEHFEVSAENPSITTKALANVKQRVGKDSSTGKKFSSSDWNSLKAQIHLKGVSTTFTQG